MTDHNEAAPYDIGARVAAIRARLDKLLSGETRRTKRAA